VRSDNRREALLDAAARLFGSRGYAATSTRDIAAEVGILAGSIYYHFPSKEALALAVHERGVNSILSAVQAAIADGSQEPWARLEAACLAHLDALLNGGSYAQVVTPNFARALPAAFVSTLIRQRDTYERLFVELVDALPLPRGTNRRYLRLALLGSLNWALTWYRPGGDSPKVIARRIVDLYRQPLDTRR
jgi:AcrR family transcriptional regulator